MLVVWNSLTRAIHRSCQVFQATSIGYRPEDSFDMLQMLCGWQNRMFTFFQKVKRTQIPRGKST